jgi:hypothetical protein
MAPLSNRREYGIPHAEWRNFPIEYLVPVELEPAVGVVAGHDGRLEISQRVAGIKE